MNHNLRSEFDNGLNKLGMLGNSAAASKLVFVDSPDVDPRIRFHVEIASRFRATAVYFRYFADGRPPIPQIYIYDLTNREFDEAEIAEIHRRLWNAGTVPLFYAFTAKDIKVFNCVRQPPQDPDTGDVVCSVLDTIVLADQVETEFQARYFDSGAFWDISPHASEFEYSSSSYEKLLEYLMKVKKNLVESKILPITTATKLLVVAILVKYLEERHDDDGNTVFPSGYFAEFADGATSFVDLLRVRGAILRLFDALYHRFNGKVFLWEDNQERADIETADLSTVANFFAGDVEHSGQAVFWRMYSFNDLPIELISNIYEEFLEPENKRKHGVVYTPPYLVNFLIDQVMPLDQPKDRFLVCDPSCGSGIFLVGAYKRLIQWWRILNDWRKPDLRTLKQLLLENVFGIDINGEAIQLSAFSLCLTLCDALTPRDIWNDLEFDDLTEANLLSSDFFALIEDPNYRVEFDLVIGNPPFARGLTGASERVEFKARQERHLTLPDEQIALLFLEQSTKICRTEGSICLIQPAGPFLYNIRSQEFRNHILNAVDLHRIYDFTALASVLFTANYPAVAIVATNTPLSRTSIDHITVRRTRSSKEKLFFELDPYDFHKISFKTVTSNPHVWKANLLGGGRLERLIERLASMRTLDSYLDEMKRKRNWLYGEGFYPGSANRRKRLEELELIEELTERENKERNDLRRQYKRAPFITGKKSVSTEALGVHGIDYMQVNTVDTTYFERPREEGLYTPPHLLIKGHVLESSIPIVLSDEYLTFTKKILGIAAPQHDRDRLQEIERRIRNNRLYLFCTASLSTQYLISRATALLTADILSIPFPDTEAELDISRLEEVLVDDVLEYQLDFRSKGELSKVAKPASGDQLTAFGETYCEVLNSVYDNFVSNAPLVLDTAVVFVFHYGGRPRIDLSGLKSTEDVLGKLLSNTSSGSAVIARLLRLYFENCVVLIKPKAARYWLRSVAIRDADDTFNDLVVQGY